MIALLEAALLFRAKKIQESADLLRSELQKRAGSNADEDGTLKLLVSLIQVLLSGSGNIEGIIEALDAVPPSLRHRPAITALLALLHERTGNISAAVSILDQTIQFQQNQKVCNGLPTSLPIMFRLTYVPLLV